LGADICRAWTHPREPTGYVATEIAPQRGETLRDQNGWRTTLYTENDNVYRKCQQIGTLGDSSGWITTAASEFADRCVTTPPRGPARMGNGTSPRRQYPLFLCSCRMRGFAGKPNGRLSLAGLVKPEPQVKADRVFEVGTIRTKTGWLAFSGTVSHKAISRLGLQPC
jgi:hypothetical protein